MKTIDQPTSETSSLTRLSCLLTVAALTSTASVLQTGRQAPQTVYVSIEPEGRCSFTRVDGGEFPALASTDRFKASVAEMSDVITNMLAKHKIHPDRTSTTGDGSRLLQFFKDPHVEAGVDIFPNGDVVVIIREGGVSRIYEAVSKDLPKIPTLLMDAGVAA